MGTQEVSGRVPAEPGSREPSPTVSAASGFDPSRDQAQVVAQCRVVAHFATALASVFNQKADAFEQGAWPTIWEPAGQESAALMETLGNILNNMDAVDGAEDAWTFPVFERAHVLFARDSDGSGEADETGTGSAVGDSACRETASHNTQVSETPSDTLGEKA